LSYTRKQLKLNDIIVEFRSFDVGLFQHLRWKRH